MMTTTTVAARAARHLYGRELIPVRARWWLSARGMLDWFRMLERGLTPHLGEGTRPVIARIAQQMFIARCELLSESYPHLKQGGQTQAARLMAALYRVKPGERGMWIFGDALPSLALSDVLRGQLLLRRIPIQGRWEEVTVHLGELLILLTNELPRALPHARKIVADICYESGLHFAQKAKRAFGISDDSPNAPADAIEILRMSEYIFRVNPEHWGHADAEANTGWLEGTACPWYSRPGWNGAHCGIFGQFQAGISAAFGLRYQLSQTIPKHGGHTCRVDLKPLVTLKKKSGTTSSVAESPTRHHRPQPTG